MPGHECGECLFVANSDFVYISPKILIKASESGNAFLGYFTQSGWKGHLPFYAVKCPACENIFADYPHGNVLYFSCRYCGKDIAISDREIYEKMNMPFPEELRKKFSNGRIPSWAKILGLLLVCVVVFLAIAEIISKLSGL